MNVVINKRKLSILMIILSVIYLCCNPLTTYAAVTSGVSYTTHPLGGARDYSRLPIANFLIKFMPNSKTASGYSVWLKEYDSTKYDSYSVSTLRCEVQNPYAYIETPKNIMFRSRDTVTTVGCTDKGSGWIDTNIDPYPTNGQRVFRIMLGRESCTYSFEYVTNPPENLIGNKYNVEYSGGVSQLKSSTFTAALYSWKMYIDMYCEAYGGEIDQANSEYFPKSLKGIEAIGRCIDTGTSDRWSYYYHTLGDYQAEADPPVITETHIANGWVKDSTIIWRVTDNSDFTATINNNAISVTVDGSYNQPIIKNGKYTLKATDAGGFVSTKLVEVTNIDTEKPIISGKIE